MKANQPELIIMDIILEGEIDGIETVELIRQQWNIPIIYFSSKIDRELFKRTKLTQPFGYLRKPFDEIELQMAQLMVNLMRQNDAPRDQYERLGLPLEGEVKQEHLLAREQYQEAQKFR